MVGVVIYMFFELSAEEKSFLEYPSIANELEDRTAKRGFLKTQIEDLLDKIQSCKNELSKYSWFEKKFNKEKYNENTRGVVSKLAFYEEYLDKYQKELNEAELIITQLESRKSDFESSYLQIKNDQLSQMKLKIKLEIINGNGNIPLIDGSIINGMKSFIDCQFDRDDFSFDDLVLVHTTDFFPTDGRINCSQDDNVVYSCDINIDDQSYHASTYSHRSSVHFALNGRVANHEYGNWDNMKFVIIEPIKHHLDIIRTFRPEDTWTNGSVELSDEAILLVKEDAYDSLDKDMIEKFQVIKFNGSNKVAVDKVLLLMGYKPQTLNKYGWSSDVNNPNTKLLIDYVNDQFPEKDFISHTGSFEDDLDKNLKKRDSLLSVLRDGIVDTRNGISISMEEVVLMYHYYALDNSARLALVAEDTKYDSLVHKIFSHFIYDYGISYDNNSFCLMDDRKILESYYNQMDFQKINSIYGLLSDRINIVYDINSEIAKNIMVNKTINNMESSAFDVSYQIIDQNVDYNVGNRTRGFTGIQLIGFISSILSIIGAVIGIIFLFMVN